MRTQSRVTASQVIHGISALLQTITYCKITYVMCSMMKVLEVT